MTDMLRKDNEFRRGGLVLIGCFIGLGVAMTTLPYYAFGVWTRPWQAEFGWSRAQIAAQQSLAVVIIMLAAPLAGKLIDRFGIRLIAPSSLAAYGLAYLALSTMQGSLTFLYFVTMVYALLGVASAPISFTRAINAFFSKNRGLALGIGLSSSGVTAFMVPRYLTPYVAEEGWRAGILVISFIIIASAPIVALLVRDAPVADNPDAAPMAETGASLSEALRHPTFWKMGAVFLLISTAILGIVPAFIPLLQDAGMSAVEAGSIASILGVSVLVGRLAIGFAVDNFFAPYVTAITFSLVALGCLALGLGGTDFALLAAVTIGFAVGAEVDLIGYYTARYFGLKHYATIYGAQYSIFVLGAGISPILVGRIWDMTGNYDLALWMAFVLLLLAAGIALLLPKFDPAISDH